MKGKLFFKISFALNLIFLTARSQTTLAPGDMAFIGLNLSSDAVSLVTYIDICPGTIIFLTDNPYRNSGGFCTSQEEFCLSMTVTVKIPKGTKITYTDANYPMVGAIAFSPAGPAATMAYAFTSTAGTNNGFSSSGDNCFAFQGSYAAPSFICGIKTHSTWTASGSVNCANRNHTELPTTLTNGTNALTLGSCTGMAYNCSTINGTQSALNSAINNSSNWSCSGSAVTLPPACTFTVSSCKTPDAATTFVSSNVTNTTGTLSWNTCYNVLVVASMNVPVSTDPINGASYTGNTNYGLGSQIGTNNYVIYQGSNTYVNMTSLNPGTTYYFAIYTYDDPGKCYNMTELTGSFTTSGFSCTLTGRLQMFDNGKAGCLAGCPGQGVCNPEITITGTASQQNMSSTVTTPPGCTVTVVSEFKNRGACSVSGMDAADNMSITAVGGTTISQSATLVSTSACAGPPAVVIGTNNYASASITKGCSNADGTCTLVQNGGTVTIAGNADRNDEIITYTVTASGSCGSSCALLSMVLKEFNASFNDNGVHFDWLTLTEVESDYFTIEMSNNSGNFIPIKKIKASGNSFQPISYSSDIEERFVETTYYRLKETDINGNVLYSPIVSINNSIEKDFVISPNPSEETIRISLNPHSSSLFKLYFYDSYGNTLEIIEEEVNEGIVEFHRSFLKKGIYFCRLEIDNLCFNKKIIIY